MDESSTLLQTCQISSSYGRCYELRYTLHDSLSYIRSYLETFGTYISAFIITKLAAEYGTHYWIIRK
jgi:hypothetical protein